jgi:hypothetical protein
VIKPAGSGVFYVDDRDNTPTLLQESASRQGSGAPAGATHDASSDPQRLCWARHGATPERQLDPDALGDHHFGGLPRAVTYGYLNVGGVEQDRLCGRTVFCLYLHRSMPDADPAAGDVTCSERSGW